MEQSLQTIRSQNNLEIWAQRVKDCRSSGLPIRQWCEENGIVPNTYFRWQKKVFNATCSEQNKFYEVTMPRITGGIAVSIEMGGISAEIHHGADEETILAVLRAMKSC